MCPQIGFQTGTYTDIDQNISTRGKNVLFIKVSACFKNKTFNFLQGRGCLQKLNIKLLQRIVIKEVFNKWSFKTNR